MWFLLKIIDSKPIVTIADWLWKAMKIKDESDGVAADLISTLTVTVQFFVFG